MKQWRQEALIGAYRQLASGLSGLLRSYREVCPELEPTEKWRGKEQLYKTGAMKLPIDLQQDISAFLTPLPNLHDRSSQRALLYSAGLDDELNEQIEVGGPPADFVRVLVDTLSRYGCLADGRHALAAILEAAQGHVGKEKQAESERLLEELKKC